jgi:hypothetical protein
LREIEIKRIGGTRRDKRERERERERERTAVLHKIMKKRNVSLIPRTSKNRSTNNPLGLMV